MWKTGTAAGTAVPSTGSAAIRDSRSERVLGRRPKKYPRSGFIPRIYPYPQGVRVWQFTVLVGILDLLTFGFSFSEKHSVRKRKRTPSPGIEPGSPA